ncbi:CLUMA_CG016047, isoform A [Clunio marinus]|uniref:CLUMA_CG016047, isoform A n=1 Tax=Clunio marinus TaxID=568069 RepID=A0A1J1IR37_9DIPT|nr:CLUMA_CG016047, isoform A [Clunio marinus]
MIFNISDTYSYININKINLTAFQQHCRMASESSIKELVKESSLAPSSVTLLNYGILKKVTESFKEQLSQRHLIPESYGLALYGESAVHMNIRNWLHWLSAMKSENFFEIHLETIIGNSNSYKTLRIKLT